MPALSVHCPQFHFSRSRAPKPSLADPRNDVAASNNPALEPSRTSSSLSSRLTLLEDGVDAVPSTSRPSVPGEHIHPHSSAGRLLGVDRAPDGFHGRPSQVSRPVSPIGAISSSVVHVLDSRGSVVQQATHLTTSPSSHPDSVQAQQLLAPPPLPCVPATFLQQSFNSESLIVSFSRDFPM